MKLAIVGHRPPKVGGYETPNAVFSEVVNAIDRALIRLQPDVVVVGMAQGVDQWAAELCILNDIPFIAAVPFTGFERMWPPRAQDKYRYLLSKASQVVVVTRGECQYHPDLLTARNHWMVQETDAVYAVWNGERRSGTASATQYAVACSRPVFFAPISPATWALARRIEREIAAERDARRQFSSDTADRPQRDLFRRPGQSLRARTAEADVTYAIPVADLFPDLMPAEAAKRARDMLASAVAKKKVQASNDKARQEAPDRTAPIRKIELDDL